MKLLTYNMQFGGRGRVHWNEILDLVQPELLLAQETYAPSEHLSPLLHGKRHEQAVWQPVRSSGKTLNWGSAVYVEDSTSTVVQLPEFQGSVVGVEIPEFEFPKREKRRLRVFSVHAPTGLGSYQKVVNSILDMLLDSREGCEVIIGGDFNLTVSERHSSEEQITEKADLKIQARLREEFGLMNCWQTANPETPLAQTLRWGSNRVIPFHCDGLFVPSSWEPHLRSCTVLSGGIWDELSDHNPVVAEFE